MQDVDAETIGTVSKSVTVLYSFARAAEVYSRAEGRCDDLRDIDRLEQ